MSECFGLIRSIPFVREAFIIRELLRLDKSIEEYRRQNDSQFSYCQVISCYRRDNLFIQLQALNQQLLTPTSVLIYQNERTVPTWFIARLNLRFIPLSPNVNWNAKYHGRFYACLAVFERLYIIWDDDILPGKRWNLRSVYKVLSENCIAVANGRTLRCSGIANLLDDGQVAESSWGDGSIVAVDSVVDYGGHSWAFRRSTLVDMAAIDPPSLRNSEDFHISAAAYIKSGTLTYVLAQDPELRDQFPDCSFNRYSADKFATHTSTGFHSERAQIISHWIQRLGFVPVMQRSR